MKTSIAEIISGLDLTAEERTQVQTILGNEKVRGSIDGELKNVQSEFSRTLDESRTAVATAKADKDAYYGQMSDWKKRQEDTLKNVQEQARKDRESAAQIKARMESLTAAGILAEEDWNGLPTTPVATTTPATPANPDPNAGRFVTQEEGLQYVQLPALLSDLVAEHQELTGRPLTNAQEIVNESISKGKTLRSVWEEKFNIPKVREERAAKVQQEHDEKIRREERTRVMSEVQNPASRQPNGAYQSPVLVAAQKTQQNTIPNVGSRRGVEMALAAHSAGKYEGGVVHNTP